MKKRLLTLSLALIAATSFAQQDWNLTFDDTSYLSRVFIDTVSNPNNIWQIGQPGKTIFNAAYSVPNAMVTDTLNPYPVNDTSSFIITHVSPYPGFFSQFLFLDFYFKLNADSLNDYGIVEASVDHGASWINLLTEDVTYGFNWYDAKPVLTGSTNGWVHYAEQLSPLTYSLGDSDTILYRFTFISDGVQTNKEGWMLDDFTFLDYWEGAEEIQNGNLVSISPNPFTQTATLNFHPATKSDFILCDVFGRAIIQLENISDGQTIERGNLASGIYYYQITQQQKTVAAGKVVVE